MTVALVIVVCVLAVVIFVLVGALVELFEQVRQIRSYLELEDKVEAIDLGAAQGIAPSAVGLPEVLDRTVDGLVLFLSNKCETCHSLASTMQGGAVPPAVWVVVVPVSGNAAEFIELFELRGDRVIVDDDELITSRVGLDLTPVALVVENGRFVRGQTVPTVRQFRAALPKVDRYRLKAEMVP